MFYFYFRTGVPSIVRSRVRLSERNPKEMIKRELRLSKAFRQGNKLVKNAFINLSPILSTIVPNVQYICTQRSVQCSSILSLFFRKCSFCLLLPFLELWHSAVSTMLLAKGCSVTIDEAANFMTTGDIRCVNSQNLPIYIMYSTTVIVACWRFCLSKYYNRS